MTFQCTGYLRLRRLQQGESPRFWSAWREHGLWGMTVHFAGLFFQVIGPFQRRKPEVL